MGPRRARAIPLVAPPPLERIPTYGGSAPRINYAQRDFVGAMTGEGSTMVIAKRSFNLLSAYQAPGDVMHVRVSDVGTGKGPRFAINIEDSKRRAASMHWPVAVCVAERWIAIAVAALYDRQDRQDRVYVLDANTGRCVLQSPVLVSGRLSKPEEFLSSWRPHQMCLLSRIVQEYASLALLPPASGPSTGLRYVVCLAAQCTISFMHGRRLVARIKTARKEPDSLFTKTGYFAGACVWHENTVYVLTENTPSGVLAVRSFTCDGKPLAVVQLEWRDMDSRASRLAIGPGGCFVVAYDEQFEDSGLAILVYSATGYIVDEFRPSIVPDPALPADTKLCGLHGLSVVIDHEDDEVRIMLSCRLSGRRHQVQYYDFRCPAKPKPRSLAALPEQAAASPCLPPVVVVQAPLTPLPPTPSLSAPPDWDTESTSSGPCSPAVASEPARRASPRTPSLQQVSAQKRRLSEAAASATKRVYSLRTRKPTQAQRPDDDYVYSDDSSSADEADDNYQ